MVKIRVDGDSIYIKTPFNYEVVSRCKNLGGKWTGEEWKCPYDKDILAAIKTMIKEVFRFDYDAPRATAKIEFKDSFWERRAPYAIGGFVLSEAHGRDSGAKTGEGVVLLQGEIRSSGSVKNWASEIEAGSVFKIKDFPIGAEVEDPENIIVTYENEDKDIDELSRFLDQYTIKDIESYLSHRKKKEGTAG